MIDAKANAKEGYMTVGEMAKKTGVTVRTLQYYDREGLLHPSAESEGGRRLYTHKDRVKLHQILSLKHLGFSLDDIKNRLISLDTPVEVATVLAEQAAAIREKIDALTKSLHDIEALRGEVLQMQRVDFKKYADIIVNLQMKNDYYWMIKHFDDQTLDVIRGRFDRESGQEMMDTFVSLRDRALALGQQGVPPQSEQGQELARDFWEMILAFTDGNMSLLPKLMELGTQEDTDQKWREQQEIFNGYIGPALEVYFKEHGIQPFEEVES